MPEMIGTKLGTGNLKDLRTVETPQLLLVRIYPMIAEVLLL